MITLRVTGMTCGHCVRSITNAVEEISSVEKVLVDLKQGLVSVEGDADKAEVRDAIMKAGYRVQVF